MRQEQPDENDDDDGITIARRLNILENYENKLKDEIENNLQNQIKGLSEKKFGIRGK